MGRVKQVKQEEMTPEPVQKQIKRGRKNAGQKKQIEQIDSISPIKRQKRANKEKVEGQEKTCKNLYPDAPCYNFPDRLEEQLVMVIISSENSAELKSILKNLTLIYINEINPQIVYDQLAVSEQEGTIYEKGGKYSVTSNYLSDFVFQFINQPSKQKQDIFTKINEEEQFDSYEVFEPFAFQCMNSLTLVNQDFQIEEI